MAFELLAAIVAGFTLAGIALIARKWTGARLPKWIVPLAGGVGLIGFTVWSEYDWFSRVSSELPDGVTVVWAPKEATPLRPWTYLVPLTTRFVAMDTRELMAHPAQADLVMAKLYNFRRWANVADGLMIVDCANDRQVLIAEGVEISAEGELTGADWQSAGPDDTFQKAACQEG